VRIFSLSRFDTLVPAALFIIGQTFIAMSTRSLGITGRFLGDYSGIIMDARVRTFPYDVLYDPIYIGSTMSCAGFLVRTVLA
jgi:phosphatidylethanolamine N-methyltransferase